MLSQYPIPSSLSYLQVADFDKIRFKYSLNPAEIEAILIKNRNLNLYYQIKFSIAMYGSNLVYLYFPIVTSNQGIKTLGTLISSDLVISDAVAYGIGVPLAVIDVLSYCFLFSPRKEALFAVLAEQDRKPYRELVWNEWTFLKENPCQFSKKWLAQMINQSVLLTTNLTGTASELLYLPLQFAYVLRWVVALPVLYLGNIYYQLYMNEDYYQGLNFFQNKSDYPFLLSEIKRGNISIPLAAWMSGFSTIALRVFPFFYFIAMTVQDVLGFWLDPIAVSIMVAWHSACVLYPTVYKSHMDDKLKVEEILSAKSKNIDKALLKVGEECYSFSEYNINQALDQVVCAVHADFKKNMIQIYGRRLLFTEEKVNILKLVTRCSLGAYFGYGIALRLNKYMNLAVAATITIPPAAFLFSSLLFQAQFERFAYKKHLKELMPLPPDNFGVNVTSGMKTAYHLASALNYIGNVSAGISLIGTIEPNFGTSSPELTTIIVLLTVDRTIALIDYNSEKMASTALDLYHVLPSLKGMKGCFFCGKRSPNSDSNPKIQITPVVAL